MSINIKIPQKFSGIDRLKLVVEYILDTEQEDYEEQSKDGMNMDNHVYTHAAMLWELLFQENE